MKFLPAAFALFSSLAPLGVHATTTTGYVIPDQYSGGICYKFWISGDNEQYAINLLMHPEMKAVVDLLNQAAATTNGPHPQMVTVTEQEDVTPPLQYTFAPTVWCLNGDGVSLKFYPTIVNVQLHP
jgi:hypothetical protein